MADLMEGLCEAAVKAVYQSRKRRVVGRYEVLKPGADTPLWNELVRATLPHLGRRGDKVRLARELGLSRQRLHKLLVEKSACPDAERTLRLLVWLIAQQRHRGGADHVPRSHQTG